MGTFLGLLKFSSIQQNKWVSIGCTTSKGEPCRLPFNYKGVEYKGCTTVANNGVPWCYTANGYGTCAESCNSCTCNSETGKISRFYFD